MGLVARLTDGAFRREQVGSHDAVPSVYNRVTHVHILSLHRTIWLCPCIALWSPPPHAPGVLPPAGSRRLLPLLQGAAAPVADTTVSSWLLATTRPLQKRGAVDTYAFIGGETGADRQTNKQKAQTRDSETVVMLSQRLTTPDPRAILSMNTWHSRRQTPRQALPDQTGPRGRPCWRCRHPSRAAPPCRPPHRRPRRCHSPPRQPNALKPRSIPAKPARPSRPPSPARSKALSQITLAPAQPPQAPLERLICRGQGPPSPPAHCHQPAAGR